MNKRLLVVIPILLTFLLSGCGGREPNETAYVVALGMDKADNGNYEMTIQYANTNAISGGASEEGGKTGSEIVEQITVEAPNIYAAIGLADHLVSKTFSLSHAKIMVFSSETARSGLKDILETLARSTELRPDLTLAVTKGSANDYLSSVTPEMEVNPVQYYQLIYQKNNLIGLPQGHARDFLFGTQTEDYDSLLPVAGVIKSGDGGEEGGESSESDEGSGGEKADGEEEQKEGDQSGQDSGGSRSGETSQKQAENEEESEAPLNENEFEYKMKDYIGGEAAIEKKNKSEAIGSAIFKKDKLVGFLGSIETEMYKIISGNYRDSYVTLYSEQTPDVPVTVKLIQKKKPDIDIDLDNKKIEINLFVESDLYSLPADYNIESDIEGFEKSSEEYMNSAMTAFVKEMYEKYDSDIFKLRQKSKSKFLTNDRYGEFKDTVKFSEFDIKVNTEFKIRRTGLIIRNKD